MKFIYPVLLALVVCSCAASSIRQPSSTEAVTSQTHISSAVMEADLRKLLVTLPSDQLMYVNTYMYERQPIEVALQDGQWEDSWKKPIELNMDFSLFRGNIFINSYFRKNVYSGVGSEVVGDPKLVGPSQPYISVSADSHLQWHTKGASEEILRTLGEGNPNGIRLYRGTNRMSVAIYFYLKNLLNRKGDKGAWDDAEYKAFQAVLARVAADSQSRDQMEYMPKWKKFAATQAKKKPSALSFAIEALNIFSPEMEGTFTTPDAYGASTFAFKNVLANVPPLPGGAVLVFNVDPKKLTADVVSLIYAGIESENATYVEIAFMGVQARKVMLESLEDETILSPVPKP